MALLLLLGVLLPALHRSNTSLGRLCTPPVDGFGGTPLSDAIRNGHLEVARLLIKHEAQVEMPVEAVASMLPTAVMEVFIT